MPAARRVRRKSSPRAVPPNGAERHVKQLRTWRGKVRNINAQIEELLLKRKELNDALAARREELRETIAMGGG